MIFKKRQDTTQEDVDDIEITPGGGNSFKDVLMSQLRRVTQLSSVEFRGGYYTTVPTKSGQEKEVYVQDSRESFSNATYALAILLNPKFDKTMRTSFTNFNTKLKRRQKDFIDKSSVSEEVILGESFYGDEADKILLETYRNKKLRLHLSLFVELSKQLFRLNYLELSGDTF
ncbi:hypothetical protein LCGC14_0548180 [marine sediment metagenome]|uniref:Uncharacterized protein n=1 Tax=marine sediment metagenome TaxID=412755 RepID=A0A0F9S996_9ZZZZ